MYIFHLSELEHKLEPFSVYHTRNTKFFIVFYFIRYTNKLKKKNQKLLTL